MKHIQLIFILFTIFCNEIVVEFVYSDEHKVSILDNSAEEKAENEKTEIESEVEADFVNYYASIVLDINSSLQSLLDRNIYKITNPFLEIHSPPPDVV